MSGKTLALVGAGVLVLVAAPLWLPFLLVLLTVGVTLLALVPAVLLTLGRVGYGWVAAAVLVPLLVVAVRAAAGRAAAGRDAPEGE